MLSVYLDFKSPRAYLAMSPTLALVERLSLEVDWKPFRVVERDVPKLGKEETVGESHRRVGAESQRQLAIKYAAHQGLELKFPETPGITDLALGVMSAIDGYRLPYIQAAFDAYWSAHADLDNPAVVQSILDKSGASLTINLEDARALLETAQDQAEEVGIVGAPAYVIAEQIFVGREHLPWIEELAKSR
jgi:2-hydroxychromene-2-carboxylate isomerase